MALPQVTAAQFTLIRQHLYPFSAPYSGPLSVTAGGDTQATYTGGIYLGWQALSNTQFYLDIEKFDGSGISHSTGLGSLTDGDAERAGPQGLSQRPYTARAYVRQLIPLGSERQTVERAQDQLAGSEATEQLEFKAGMLASSDDFDRNRYAGGARSQFMNWSFFNNTAWDFAADTRGYTAGFMLGWEHPLWAWRNGWYKMPVIANGQALAALDQASEFDSELTLNLPQGLVIRAMIYRNWADMGTYATALALAHGSTPDILLTRKPDTTKTGWGLNMELPLADAGETGLFLRAGSNDGRTESFAFTEIDRQISAGMQLSGAHWYRSGDHVGLAYVIAGLSAEHAAYLRAGGLGFDLGDGRLNYAAEQAMECYYQANLPYGFSVSPDIQRLYNPGFNRDRGPMWVLGLRLHLQY